MSQKNTIEKAYGNIPKEVSYSMETFAWVPTYRGFKYYWYKLLRKVTR